VTSEAPLVVGILYPDYYDGDGSDVPRQDAAIRAVADDVEIVRVGYEESTELRAGRGSGDWAAHEALIPELTDDQRAALGRVDVALAFDLPLDVGTHAPNLKWVQALASGVAHLRSAGLADAQVRLTTAAGLSAVSIAEFVLGRMIEVWKGFPRLAAAQANGEWIDFAHGRTLRGSTLCVVGMGAIGAEVSARAAAFGVRVIGCRRNPDGASLPVGVERVVGPDELDSVLGEADAVVTAVPETDETIDLFDAARFGAMKPGAFFCNVGRGSAVVDDDLVAALGAGKVGVAAIDVTRTEPLPAGHPFWTAPNLLLSPHSAASADRYMANAHELFCDNLARFIAIEPLRNEIDPATGY
jgi:phosphoglycerate dehydrogenase-like enzyme